jgi:hypothetical protein
LLLISSEVKYNITPFIIKILVDLQIKYIIRIPNKAKPETNTFCIKYFIQASTVMLENFKADKHISKKNKDSITTNNANKSTKDTKSINKKETKPINNGYSTKLCLAEDKKFLEIIKVIIEKNIIQTFKKNVSLVNI